MNVQTTQLKEILLAGISVRTNNGNEMNPELAKIGSLFNRFNQEGVGETILNRVNPGVIYSVYTDYETDEHGDYTYFLGEEVRTFEEPSNGLTTLSIPASKYTKFTIGPGKMPQILIEAWKEIWGMNPIELGGKRTYRADFEIYDNRAQNPDNTSLDILIGID